MTVPAKVAIPVLLIIPGGAGVGYATYKYASTPDDLMRISEYEGKYGGCQFWFVKSKNGFKGWTREQAIYADDLRKGRSGGQDVDKLEKLFEQLEKPDDASFKSENDAIKAKCTEKKGSLLEIKWHNKKWSVDENWGSVHNPPS